MLFRSIFKKTGSLYALINNGAYGQAGALEDISRNSLEKQFQANVFGWHELTNLVLPRMRELNVGRIIYKLSIRLRCNAFKSVLCVLKVCHLRVGQYFKA